VKEKIIIEYNNKILLEIFKLKAVVYWSEKLIIFGNFLAGKNVIL